MAIIVPAILEETKEGFETKSNSFVRLLGVERIQVDFCDGKFVAHKSLSIADIDSLNPAYVWEAHLMVEEPVDFFDYQMAGFKFIIVHLEAFKSSEQLLSSLKQIRALGLKTGLAINPETDVATVQIYDSLVDQYTLLEVHPGTQGQELLEGSFLRIAKLRNLLPHAIIEVDGGVRLNNVKQILEAGSDVVVVGSALAGDPEWDFEKFREALAM